MGAVIADNGLVADIDAELIQLFCEEEGIGVLPEWGEQLRADGDDLGSHVWAIRGAVISAVGARSAEERHSFNAPIQIMKSGSGGDDGRLAGRKCQAYDVVSGD